MDTRQFIAEHLHDDVSELALKYSNAKVDMALALRQIAARQTLQKKVPSWSANEDLRFPAHLPLEQCSSETTAQYKASLLQGTSFVDLTGGLGVDCSFIARHFSSAGYVEQNDELCELAVHNFQTLGQDVTVHHDTAESFLTHCPDVDCLFIDPARRDQHGRKTVSIADCTPNVVELQDLMLDKARRVMVKLSPMLDIRQALKELRHVKEVHVVAVANECKELLFLMESGFDGAPRFTCVNLQTDQSAVSFTQEDERDATLSLAAQPQAYLYEPNAALMKAGCFQLLCPRYQVRKLHPNSHLYTSDTLVAGFPGRIFIVEGWAPYNKRVGQTLLAGVTKASIATRNFPLSVAELRHALKIADGDEVYLFATTLGNGQKILIMSKKKCIFASLIP